MAESKARVERVELLNRERNNLLEKLRASSQRMQQGAAAVREAEEGFDRERQAAALRQGLEARERR